MAETVVIDFQSQIDGIKKADTALAHLAVTDKANAEQFAKSNQAFQTGLKQTTSQAQDTIAVFKQLAVAVGIGLSVEKVIEFGKESLKAFRDAEVNANKLKFAVQQLAGGSTSAFGKLIEQSEKLQKISIFSDDDIQKSQTLLLQLGLTTKQTEALIPKILDLASAQGTDLLQATDKVINGINGQTKSLKDAGITFSDTGSKTKNLSILTEQLGKFQGSTAVALNTSAGAAKNLENRIDDLQESIGKLIDRGNKIAASTLFDFFDIISGKGPQLQGAGNALKESYANTFDDLVKTAEKGGKEVRDKQVQVLNKQIAEVQTKLTGKLETTQRLSLETQLATYNKYLGDLNALFKESDTIKNDLTLKGEADLMQKQAELQKQRLEDEKAFRDAMVEADELMNKMRLQAAKDYQDDLVNQDNETLALLLENREIDEVTYFETLDKKRIKEGDTDQARYESVVKYNELKKKSDKAYYDAKNELIDAESQALIEGADLAASLLGKESGFAKAFMIFSKIAAIGNLIIQLQKEKAANFASAAELTAASGGLGAPAFTAAAIAKNQAANIRTGIGIATIIAQTIPQLKLAKGTKSVQGGQPGQDSVHALLMPDEMVVPTARKRKYSTALNAIFDEKIAPEVINEFVRAAMTGSLNSTSVTAKFDEYSMGRVYGRANNPVVRSIDALRRDLRLSRTPKLIARREGWT